MYVLLTPAVFCVACLLRYYIFVIIFFAFMVLYNHIRMECFHLFLMILLIGRWSLILEIYHLSRACNIVD